MTTDTRPAGRFDTLADAIAAGWTVPTEADSARIDRPEDGAFLVRADGVLSDLVFIADVDGEPALVSLYPPADRALTIIDLEEASA